MTAKTAMTAYIEKYFTGKVKKCCLAVLYISIDTVFKKTAVTPLIFSVFLLLLIPEKNKTATQCTYIYIGGNNGQN